LYDNVILLDGWAFPQVSGIYAFEWDEINSEHLAARGVTDLEVEELLDNEHVLMPNRKHEGRSLLVGHTSGGRTLVVSIEPTRDSGTWRPITARDAEPEERRKLKGKLR
jgi:uncharacterized DUF497 family protein